MPGGTAGWTLAMNSQTDAADAGEADGRAAAPR